MMRALLLVVVAACGSSSAPVSPAERAVAEFPGAYPDTESPTGVIRSFDIVAEPTELPLVDGKALEVWAYNGQVPGPIRTACSSGCSRATVSRSTSRSFAIPC